MLKIGLFGCKDKQPRKLKKSYSTIVQSMNVLGGFYHWIDEDRDCQNVRHQVLIEESLSTVGFKSSKECRVVSGSWNDPYSGKTVTDTTKLDIVEALEMPFAPFKVHF